MTMNTADCMAALLLQVVLFFFLNKILNNRQLCSIYNCTSKPDKMHINEFRKIMLAKKAAQAAQQIQIVQQMQSTLDDSYLMGTSMNGEDFILRKHMFDKIRQNMKNFK